MKNLKLYIVGILFSAAVMGILYYFSILNTPLIFGLEVPEVKGSIDFLQLVYWLWLFFPLWFTAGYMFDEELKMRHITLHRYGSGRKWWLRIVLHLFLLSAVYGVLLYFIAGIGIHKGKWEAVLLIMVHAVMMLFLFAALFILTGKRIVSTGVLIFTEAFCFILPEYCGAKAVYVPSMWSMYIRCSLFESGGFHMAAVIAVQSAVIVVIISAVYVVSKKTDIIWRMKREDY